MELCSLTEVETDESETEAIKTPKDIEESTSSDLLGADFMEPGGSMEPTAKAACRPSGSALGAESACFLAPFFLPTAFIGFISFWDWF